MNSEESRARLLKLSVRFRAQPIPRWNKEADQAQLRILIDRQKVARYGINIDDIQQLIELAIGGRAISPLFVGERRFDITARYPAAARTDIADLRNILV